MNRKIDSILNFIKAKKQVVDNYDPETKVLTLVNNDGTIQTITDIEKKYADMLISLKDD